MATETSNASSGITSRLRSASTTTILIVVGALLFVFPEPITSIIGIVLLVVGVLSWAVGRFR